MKYSPIGALYFSTPELALECIFSFVYKCCYVIGYKVSNLGWRVGNYYSISYITDNSSINHIDHETGFVPKYGFLFYHWSVYQVWFSVLPLVSLSSMLFCSTIGQFIKYAFLFYHWSVYQIWFSVLPLVSLYKYAFLFYHWSVYHTWKRCQYESLDTLIKGLFVGTIHIVQAKMMWQTMLERRTVVVFILFFSLNLEILSCPIWKPARQLNYDSIQC